MLPKTTLLFKAPQTQGVGSSGPAVHTVRNSTSDLRGGGQQTLQTGQGRRQKARAGTTALKVDDRAERITCLLCDTVLVSALNWPEILPVSAQNLSKAMLFTSASPVGH